MNGMDPNRNNLVSAGIIHAGNLEPNLEQNMYDLIVRTASEFVSE